MMILATKRKSRCRRGIHFASVFFDFQCVEEITTDLSEYYDIQHYSPAVNERMARMMAAGEARVTEKNQAANRRRIEELSRGPNPCAERP